MVDEMAEKWVLQQVEQWVELRAANSVVKLVGEKVVSTVAMLAELRVERSVVSLVWQWVAEKAVWTAEMRVAMRVAGSAAMLAPSAWPKAVPSAAKWGPNWVV